MAGYLSPQENWAKMQAANGQPVSTSGTSDIPGAGLMRPGMDTSQQVAALTAGQGDIDPSSMGKLSRIQEASYLTDALNKPKGDNLEGLDPNTMGGGFIEGYTAAKNIKAQQFQQSVVGEKLAFERTDRNEKRNIDAGMRVAAQKGGFNGVIDYLTVADPDRALAFTEKKLQLDKSMMQNDMYASMLPVEKAKAMAEGYGVLGKMGFALLKAPEKDRDDMYKTMLPMIKNVNPDAPSTLNGEAVGMFMLGIAQSTDENQLYGYNKTNNLMQSQIGKMTQDIQTASKIYGPDSEQVQILRNSLNGAVEQKDLNRVTTANNILNKSASANASKEAVLRKEVANYNKGFMTVQDNYNKVMNVSKNYSDPTVANYGPSDVGLVFNFMKILDPNSVVRESEFATAANSGGIPQSVQAEYNKVLKGGVLSPTMRNEFIKTSKQLYEASKQTYDQVQEQYKGVAVKNGLNPDNVILNVNSAQKASEQTINSKADALIQKYHTSPEAISKIETIRKQELQKLNASAATDDQNADTLLKTYGR